MPKESEKAGLAPGTVVHIGKRKVEKVSLDLIDYTSKNIIEKELKKVEDAFPYKRKSTNTWLNVVGLHDTEIIEKIGKEFKLHPLTQEDIANTGERPSFEDYHNYLFVSLKMLDYKRGRIVIENVSIVIGKNYLITFQEKKGDVFETIRKRLKRENSKLRNYGIDYLAYSLIDAIVDNYFVVLDKKSERIEELEIELQRNSDKSVLTAINKVKGELLMLRKAIWPLRDVIGKMKITESKLITPRTAVYMTDVYDHIAHAMDDLDSYREITAGMADMYLSTVSNRMNSVMKVLTIFAAIFIPLTFLAGVFGMNFWYMPLLYEKHGFYVMLGIFAVIALIMLMFFRKKEWV